MDRNFDCFARTFFLSGQARKSLWIETRILGYGLPDWNLVRLVRACGSKPFAKAADYSLFSVRLVRACGSKLSIVLPISKDLGQARKSLWIETIFSGWI